MVLLPFITRPKKFQILARAKWQSCAIEAFGKILIAKIDLYNLVPGTLAGSHIAVMGLVLVNK